MLWCIGRYSSSLGAWKPGDGPIDNPALEAALLRDSPLSFSKTAPGPSPALQSAALPEPPQDKMLRSPSVATKEPLLNPGVMDATTHAALLPPQEQRRGRGRGRA